MEENYEVRHSGVEKQMRDIGRILKDTLPKEWGFALQIFSYGEKGSLFYISSAERSGMIKALEEFIEREKRK